MVRIPGFHYCDQVQPLMGELRFPPASQKILKVKRKGDTKLQKEKNVCLPFPKLFSFLPVLKTWWSEMEKPSLPPRVNSQILRMEWKGRRSLDRRSRVKAGVLPNNIKKFFLIYLFKLLLFEYSVMWSTPESYSWDTLRFEPDDMTCSVRN